MQENLATTDQFALITFYGSVYPTKNHEIKLAETRRIMEQLSSSTLCLEMPTRFSKKLDKAHYEVRNPK